MAHPEAMSRSRALMAGVLTGGWRGVFLRWLALPAAAVAALVIGAVIILAMGANPLTGYHALVSGGFAGSYALTATAVKAVPLLLVGVGICIAFRANVLNIGGEGQIAMGGLASTATALALPNLPSIVLIPLVLLAGAAGGAVWGAIPGLFKAYRNVNEVLSTIMLNLVALQLMNYLLSGPMIDKSESFAVVGEIPQTRLLSPNSWLPILIPGTQFHLGVVIAVLVAIAAWVLLRWTGTGFRLRAVGLSTEASRYAGMRVKRTITMAMTLSGAMCGLAGAMLVFGSISHRMVTDGSLTGFTGSDGYYGIVVALFAGLSPLWTIASAFLFGGMLVGGVSMGIALGVPYSQDLVTLIVGLLVCFVVAIDAVRKRSNVQAGRSAEAWHQLLAIALPRLRAGGAPGSLGAAAPGRARRPVTAAGPGQTVDAQAMDGQVMDGQVSSLAPAERSEEAPQ
jgi:general nucleoside transport system permease protein